MPRDILIFDTTLRDGEQSPGATLTVPEKLEVADALVALGVDIIEAGFPIASPGDLEAVRSIAARVRGATVAGLARCVFADIDAVAEGVRPAESPRIHTFVNASDIQIQHQLRSTRERVLETADACVRRAKGYVADIEFSPMDATRADPAFVAKLCGIAIAAGATTVNIPDTVGYATPDEFYRFMRDLIEQTPGGDRVTWSVHCHDDLGLATANTLAGVLAGANQIEVTVNGIGERAGNTSLEEIVMALRTRADFYRDCRTRVVSERLVPTSRLVSRLTSIVVQPNKAIVGANAFAHESGIHQDGILKHAGTYEIMAPQSVGWDASKLVLGKHSGRHALSARLKEMGYVLEGDHLQQIYQRFTELTDRKKIVTEADLIAIAENELAHGPQEDRYALEHFSFQSASGGRASATVTVVVDGVAQTAGGTGNGPVEAMYRAIDSLTGVETALQSYAIQAVTPGEDAQGEVHVVIRAGDRISAGRGLATDVVEASALAYLQALNKLALTAGIRERVVEGVG
ncbi:MAG: 2-isopropylmalate synthase [Chloroflexi bacterium]|nr:2-isopropylmalate synthase [Chloroflexota bacterium]